MAAGYRTRVATVVTWYLVFALQVRNPAVDYGGDNVLRMMLFWSMFLPLGARWSLDRAAGRQSEPARGQVLSVATVAARLQLCLVYWVTAALKWNPAWLGDGTALGTALRLDYLSTPAGRLLLRFPGLLRLLTRAAFGLELLGPLAAWSPWRSGPVRSLVVLAFVVFHLGGIAPAFRLGIFPWVCAVAWTIFLPAWLWERLAAGRLGALMAALDRRDRRGAGSATSVADSSRDANSAGDPHSAGASETGRATAPAGHAAGVAPGAGSARGSGSGRLSPGRAAWRRPADALLALLLAYVVLLNLREIRPQRFGSLLPPVTDRLAETLALHQRWDMFTPAPPTDDGWPVAAARTRAGEVVDAWREAPLDLSRPPSFAAVYGDARWTKYLTNLRRPSYVFHRRLFGNYLCRRWNAAHPGPGRLDRLTLVYMLERTLPPDRELPAEPLVLYAQTCAGP
jgi:hypothetical protein